MTGRDVFVCLLTGCGKSCFAVLLLAYGTLHSTNGSLVLIVSPLIALMRDQMSNFKKGLRAVYVSMNDEET